LWGLESEERGERGGGEGRRLTIFACCDAKERKELGKEEEEREERELRKKI